jgi:NAD(P)-dependent dehydrogenase (short-subunit alcohol dehydrogenase family)
MNKSIFITGAASGIGRETALYFAERGWFVGLFDVNEPALAALCDQIGNQNSWILPVDVTCPDSIRAAADGMARRTGDRLDVLFNNAGVLYMGRHHTIPLEHQKRTVDVNLIGILNGIDACFDLLRATPGARVVNMSSASALYGTPELAVYSATKAAVCALTDALNIEFEPLGIHVCDVMAPYVRTPLITAAPIAATSVSRLGVHITPRQVAEVVWRAAHGRRRHWQVGLAMRLLRFSTLAFPFFQRPLVKMLAFSNPR